MMPTAKSLSRSSLCVPGDRHDRVSKALASAADAVVIDFEDAVAPMSKEAARAVLDAIVFPSGPGRPRVGVRINALGSPWAHLDLLAVAASAAPVEFVVLPKSESRADVAFAERLLDGAAPGRDIRLHALIESARGMERASEIMSERDRLDAVVIGYADLSASLGWRRPTAPVRSYVQQTLIIRARAADILIYDGPFLGVQDDADFRREVGLAAEAGVDGKWIIHPRQLDAVNTAFSPSDHELEEAVRVLDALAAAHEEGIGAIELDGELIDEAMAVSARDTIARAHR